MRKRQTRDRVPFAGQCRHSSDRAARHPVGSVPEKVFPARGCMVAAQSTSTAPKSGFAHALAGGLMASTFPGGLARRIDRRRLKGLSASSTMRESELDTVVCTSALVVDHFDAPPSSPLPPSPDTGEIFSLQLALVPRFSARIDRVHRGFPSVEERLQPADSGPTFLVRKARVSWTIAYDWPRACRVCCLITVD